MKFSAFIWDNLGQVCDAWLEDIRAGNPEQQFVQRMSGELNLQAAAARMQQARSNLLSNAVQHGNRQSPVSLTVDGEVDAVVLKVCNSGDPIPAGRFWRSSSRLFRRRAPVPKCTNARGPVSDWACSSCARS